MKNIRIVYQVEKIRLEKGISKKQLSRLTGLEYNVVSGFLNEKRNNYPKLSTLVKYALALNVPVKDLFIEIEEFIQE
jgi:transcriptional regulator with XRE-family HTH domain